MVFPQYDHAEKSLHHVYAMAMLLDVGAHLSSHRVYGIGFSPRVYAMAETPYVNVMVMKKRDYAEL